MISKEKKEIQFCYEPYYSTDGVFSLFNKLKMRQDFNVYYCREEFSDYFKSNCNWVTFICKNLNIAYLNKFFTKIETQLKISKKTVFYKTNNKHVVILNISPFWLENSTKRGFFTLFLRCGGTCYSGNFNNAIDAYSLTRQIKNTINWFLSGNTKVTEDVDGGSLVDTFKNMDAYRLSAFLVKEKKSKGYFKHMLDIGILKLVKA